MSVLHPNRNIPADPAEPAAATSHHDPVSPASPASGGVPRTRSSAAWLGSG